jgi:YD repeat-containing protein
MKQKNGGFLARASLAIALIAAVQPVFASYYYVIDGGTSDPDAVQYPSADAACQTAYANDVQQGSPFPGYPFPPPYTAPVLVYESPRAAGYNCYIAWQQTPGDTINVALFAHGVTRLGNNCGDGTSYNQATGACEKKDDELDRMETGDVSATVAGMCFVGDPINPAGGNVYEREVDYTDRDGVLVLARVYNSRVGGWTMEADSQIWFDRDGAAVVFPDGHISLFKRSGDLYAGEPGERGTLTYTAGVWSYTSPDTTVYSYTMAGTLSGIRYPSGRFVTFVRNASNPFASTTTMTDDLGHSLVVNYAFNRLGSATVDGLTVSYTFDSSNRLSKVARKKDGHTTIRQYLYEDTVNTNSMTGLIDERGVRIATWTYDAQNRAVSSSMPLAAGKVTVVYGADGTTTVSNALGHPVTYEYQLVNGGKRISAIHGEAVAGCPAANSTFTYTDAGQMATRTNALGQVTAFVYDDEGRETSRTEAKGTPDERQTTTTWDGTSFRPKTVTTPDRQTTYSYDVQGHLLSTTIHSVKE